MEIGCYFCEAEIEPNYKEPEILKRFLKTNGQVHYYHYQCNKKKAKDNSFAFFYCFLKINIVKLQYIRKTNY